ncbi:MAG: hypothetical protein AAFQ82_20170, partial [Myxococcota bacterium]
DAHAAYFKSGSLYQCKPEPGFTCIQYQGNVVNVLNALVEIETAPPEPPATEESSPAEATNDSVQPVAPQGAEAGGEELAKEKPTEDGAKDATKSAVTQNTDPAKPADADAENEAAQELAAPEPKHVYIVSVMSNELKRNAAMDHARLADQIHQAITGEK